MSKYYIKMQSYFYPTDPPEGIIDPGFLLFSTFDEAFAEAQKLAPNDEDQRQYHGLIEVGFFSQECPVIGIEKWKNATQIALWPPRKRWTEKDGWVDLNDELYKEKV